VNQEMLKMSFQTGESLVQPARKRLPKETWDIFNQRFSACRRSLRFIAREVLGNSQDAELAVENCWFTASRSPASFDSEGAFRSWLLRVLIDEALAVRRGRPTRALHQKTKNHAPVS
jgi:DNA-directed RNA polymerase specialized sigma24 family protein